MSPWSSVTKSADKANAKTGQLKLKKETVRDLNAGESDSKRIIRPAMRVNQPQAWLHPSDRSTW